MTTFTKTITTMAAALILMTAASAQARQSDFVPTSELGQSAGSQVEYMWEQNLNSSPALQSSYLVDNTPSYEQQFDQAFNK